VLVSCAALCGGSAAVAASINYGDFGPVPPGVMFLDVRESSATDPVPLYGSPDLLDPPLIGLDFDPTTFGASAPGGGADLTDGQLNFTVMSTAGRGGGVGIDSISLFESGDYTLIGVGTAATQVLAGAIMSAKVTQVDGAPVAPINLLPVNGSVGFNLPANPGLVQPWSLGLVLDVASQVNVPHTIGATKVEVVINNQLAAISEPGAIAFIAKKEFVIEIIPDDNFIPEPASALLFCSALTVLGLFVRGRRQ
jgi:hypothetical protein